MIEKIGSEWIRTEYRINKKGAEFFRTDDRDDAYSRLAQLQEKRPGVFTIQSRHRRENKYGQPVIFNDRHNGWSLWG